MNINGDFSTNELLYKKNLDTPEKTQCQDNGSIFGGNDSDAKLTLNNTKFPSVTDTAKEIEEKMKAQKGPKDTKLNGKIDTQVKQGNTGDCWVLSSVLALNSTDKGKELIKDAITLNNDGSATVNFKGVGKSYKISAQEINKHDTDYNFNDAYSNGDNDMLVLEMATERLRQDIKNGEVESPDGVYYNLAKTNDGIDGGYTTEMMYYLTGAKSTNVVSFFGETNLLPMATKDALEKATINDETAVSFSLHGEHSAKLNDGTYYIYNGGGHAFAVTNLDKDNKTVTFVNPWDSQKEYTMSWDEFANLRPARMTLTDLSKVG